MLAISLRSIICVSLVLLTTSYAAETATYFIMPVENLSPKDCRLLQSYIEELAGGPQWVYASTTPSEPIPTYWGATLPLAGFHELERNKFVCTSFISSRLLLLHAADCKDHPEQVGDGTVRRLHDTVISS